MSQHIFTANGYTATITWGLEDAKVEIPLPTTNKIIIERVEYKERKKQKVFITVFEAYTVDVNGEEVMGTRREKIEIIVPSDEYTHFKTLVLPDLPAGTTTDDLTEKSFLNDIIASCVLLGATNLNGTYFNPVAKDGVKCFNTLTLVPYQPVQYTVTLDGNNVTVSIDEGIGDEMSFDKGENWQPVGATTLSAGSYEILVRNSNDLGEKPVQQKFTIDE